MSRLRYLLSDPTESVVCLNDLVTELLKCSDYMRELEYKNTNHALKNAKKAMREFKLKFIELELRLKNEVTEEVMLELSKRDKNVVIGNPNKVREANERRRIERENK